ncbi:MAG: hypothetical protein H5U30_01985 [Marinobacter sp.]|jgi:hypothetical protein|nr:hypothetical protein [Marinobacter sp.]
MPTLHRTNTLKLYRAVSTLNPINRLTVTAFSLREARGLLPAAAVVVGWAPAREVQS